MFKKEQTLWQKSVEHALTKIDTAFVRAIPSDDVKQLPPKYLYPAGLMVFMVLFGIFIAVFVPGDIFVLFENVTISSTR